MLDVHEKKEFISWVYHNISNYVLYVEANTNVSGRNTELRIVIIH